MTIGAMKKWYGMTCQKACKFIERPHLGLYSTNTTKV